MAEQDADARGLMAYSPLLSTPLRQLARSPLATIAAEASVREAAEQMRRARVSSLLVMQAGELAGIITDRDLRNRVLAEGRSADTPVHAVMSGQLICAQADESALEALLTMARCEIRHLPVLDGQRLIGIISTSDLLQLSRAHPLPLIAELRRQTSPEALAASCRRLPTLLVMLVDSGASAYQVGRLMSAVADAIAQRLIALAEGELGPPPAPYAWLIFGSQAREEQGLASDQDHALLIDNSVDAESDHYFAALAERVSAGLADCGYRRCPGGVMASNPRWRMPLAGWQHTFRDWILRPEPQALMHATIFFDGRCLHGEAALWQTLQQEVLALTAKQQIFLAHLAREALKHRPPLGPFGRLATQGGKIDVKHRGVVPIIDLARVYALAAGIPAVNTQARLTASAQHGLSREGSENLRGALELIATLRFRHQAQQVRRGEAPDNQLALEQLSPFERRQLRTAAQVVRDMQNALAERYASGQLG